MKGGEKMKNLQIRDLEKTEKTTSKKLTKIFDGAYRRNSTRRYTRVGIIPDGRADGKIT